MRATAETFTTDRRIKVRRMLNPVLLMQKLFAGPWLLAQKTGVSVIPVTAFHENDADTIYIYAGEPLDLGSMDKKPALELLRDVMATQVYTAIEAHSTPLHRAELRGDIHWRYMEERRQEYLRVHWTRDIWDEELTVYRDKQHPLPQEVRSTLDKVKVTPANADILAPSLPAWNKTAAGTSSSI